MCEKEIIIKNYFSSWLNNDYSCLNEIFDDNIIYSECYGPEYHGMNQIKQWFTDWNKRGKVLTWDIKQFIHQDNMTVVEWYFKCNFDGIIDGFDGVSIIEFDSNRKIINLKEFQSKSEHEFPYGRK